MKSKVFLFSPLLMILGGGCVEPAPQIKVQLTCGETSRVILQEQWNKHLTKRTSLYCLQTFTSQNQKVFNSSLDVEQETPVQAWHHVKCSEKPLTCP